MMSDIDDLEAFGEAALRSDGAGLTTADERDAVKVPDLVPRNQHMSGFISEAKEEEADSVAPTPSKANRAKKRPPPSPVQSAAEETNAEKHEDTSPPDDDDCERPARHVRVKSLQAAFSTPDPRTIQRAVPMEDTINARQAAFERYMNSPGTPDPPITIRRSSSFCRVGSPEEAIMDFDRTWGFLLDNMQYEQRDPRACDVVAHLNIFKDSFRVMHAQMEGDNPWEKAMQYILLVMSTTQRVLENTRPKQEKIDEEVKTLMPPIVSLPKKASSTTSQKVRSQNSTEKQPPPQPPKTKPASVPLPPPAAPPPPEQQERKVSVNARGMNIPHKKMSEGVQHRLYHGTADYDTDDNMTTQSQKGWFASLFS